MKQQLKKIFDGLWKITDDFNYEIIQSKSEKPFENEKPNFEEKEINQAYIKDNKKWFHSEYVKKLKQPVIIEPDYSYAITDFNKIVRSSITYTGLIPSFPRYIISKFRPGMRIRSAILFDGQVGTNYFHFYSNVINKIWLFKHIDEYTDLPIVIGEKTFNTKYFQFFLKNTELKNFNWLVQKKGKYIKVDELYLINPMPYKKSYFNQIRSLLNVPEIKARNRLVFLNRSKASGRYIENFEEIQPILQQYGFEIVDTNNTDQEFQINLFNSVKYLVSIHGAGNTNIIFADSTLRFLEINPANRISCQYYWLAKTLGLEYYDIILGDKLPLTNVYPEKGFYLEPQKLARAIRRLIDKH